MTMKHSSSARLTWPAAGGHGGRACFLQWHHVARAEGRQQLWHLVGLPGATSGAPVQSMEQQLWSRRGVRLLFGCNNLTRSSSSWRGGAVASFQTRPCKVFCSSFGHERCTVVGQTVRCRLQPVLCWLCICTPTSFPPRSCIPGSVLQVQQLACADASHTRCCVLLCWSLPWGCLSPPTRSYLIHQPGVVRAGVGMRHAGVEHAAHEQQVPSCCMCPPQQVPQQVVVVGCIRGFDA